MSGQCLGWESAIGMKWNDERAVLGLGECSILVFHVLDEVEVGSSASLCGAMHECASVSI